MRPIKKLKNIRLKTIDDPSKKKNEIKPSGNKPKEE